MLSDPVLKSSGLYVLRQGFRFLVRLKVLWMLAHSPRAWLSPVAVISKIPRPKSYTLQVLPQARIQDGPNMPEH